MAIHDQWPVADSQIGGREECSSSHLKPSRSRAQREVLRPVAALLEGRGTMKNSRIELENHGKPNYFISAHDGSWVNKNSPSTIWREWQKFAKHQVSSR